ncbi:hypothetical protein FHG87_002377 [Trinorchestia longiramus]|nr:hypothetical protein FHG87_002377 [Trinorchestia longiramus]
MPSRSVDSWHKPCSSYCRVVCFVLLMILSEAWCENITTEVFGSYNEFKPAAFGDFNSDKHTDLFVIENDSKTKECTVRVLLSAQNPPLLRPDGPNCSCPGSNVKSVVPSDFDGDGAMDMMMLSLRSDGLYDVYLAYGDVTNLTCPTEKVLTVRGQPVMMDYDGDMISDLFGESEDRVRSFWLFKPSRGPPIHVPMLYPDSKEHLPALRVPSSHAFVDLNGDLAADLFVTTEKQFEIWENSAGGFSIAETIPVPAWAVVVGQTTFMDVSLSGHVEPLTVLCRKEDCSDGQIYVWSYVNNTREKDFVPLGFALVDEANAAWYFPSNSHHSYPYTDVINLRVADVDLDGYPDLLLTLLDSHDNPRVVMAMNRPCVDACSSHSRRFVPDWSRFASYPNSVLGAFFDVFEDGRMDILLLHQNPGTPSHYVMAAVQDTQEYDAMFLKVLVPSGHCYESCPNGVIPYGTNPAGPSFRYYITTADDSMQVSAATQLSQSAHMALQLPYTLFGLGRNWNFVEVLQVGIAIKESPDRSYGFYQNNSDFDDVAIRNMVVSDADAARNGLGLWTHKEDAGSLFPSARNFTQIIPNSQVIVIPYPLDRPDRWVNKLYMTPSKALTLTAAALLVVCLVVGMIIGVLHFREKREDRREKLQQAQDFHYDAM